MTNIKADRYFKSIEKANEIRKLSEQIKEFVEYYVDDFHGSEENYLEELLETITENSVKCSNILRDVLYAQICKHEGVENNGRDFN